MKNHIKEKQLNEEKEKDNDEKDIQKLLSNEKDRILKEKGKSQKLFQQEKEKTISIFKKTN